ncbi:josephin-2 [Frankliniella occidentalis]|uniref:Josephin-2 n=1 Tax=Frankliniella occidentalis TaxID=133901 RepID=A0A6J1TJT3_FRAOC|nr:josephin-2 [Frankliniella occidentalis]
MWFGLCRSLTDCWQKPWNKIGVEMPNSIYHEKQVRELCALHALNNLFQQQGAFTKEEFDEICGSLSPNTWINPHKSIMGLGNYDINVIMTALQRKGYEAIWFDKRKDPKCLNLPLIRGFILNIPGDYKLMLVQMLLRRKHWVAIREIDGSYYNLDSKLDSPELIGKGEELLAYLKSQLENKEKELFVIIPLEVERSQLWQVPDSEISNGKVQGTEIHSRGVHDDIESSRQHTSSSNSSGAGGSGLCLFGRNLVAPHSVSSSPCR